MRIAVLADLHGNLPALEAVGRRMSMLDPAPDIVVVNGDLINGAPMSAAVIDHVRNQNWLVVRGNHEFYYLDFGTDRAPSAYSDQERWGQLHWLVTQITAEQGAYLATLPDELTFFLPGSDPIRIAHGVPGENRTGFYPRQDPCIVARCIDHVQEPVLISAHTHVQFDRYIVTRDQRIFAVDDPGMDPRILSTVRSRLENSDTWWHVINPGSVGLPLNGNVLAQFAVFDNCEKQNGIDNWSVTMQQVSYDRRPILDAFRTSGMLDVGGIISQLFYWELCTAEPEIIHFYRWAHKNGHDPDRRIEESFLAYIEATARDKFIDAHDPCIQGNSL